MRRRPAIRESISSIFAAIRTRNASDGDAERRAARRYSPISARVKPTACASLIARRKRTVSSSYRRCPLRLSRRLRKQAAALVVAERLDVHACTCSDLADSHDPSIDPYQGTEFKRSCGPRWARPGGALHRAACNRLLLVVARREDAGEERLEVDVLADEHPGAAQLVMQVEAAWGCSRGEAGGARRRSPSDGRRARRPAFSRPEVEAFRLARRDGNPGRGQFARQGHSGRRRSCGGATSRSRRAGAARRGRPRRPHRDPRASARPSARPSMR